MRQISKLELERLAESCLIKYRANHPDATPSEVYLIKMGILIATLAHVGQDNVRRIRRQILSLYDFGPDKVRIIKDGENLMNSEIKHSTEVIQPKPGEAATVYLLMGLKDTPTEENLQKFGTMVGSDLPPHQLVGNFKSMEELNEFVEGGNIPEDWPFYAVLIAHVNYYVVGSDILTDQEMLDHPERWEEYEILGGPFTSIAEGLESCKNAKKQGSWKGTALASLVESDAKKMKTSKSRLQ